MYKRVIKVKEKLNYIKKGLSFYFYLWYDVIVKADRGKTVFRSLTLNEILQF